MIRTLAKARATFVASEFAGDRCRFEVLFTALRGSQNGNPITNAQVTEFDLRAIQLQVGILGHEDFVLLGRFRGSRSSCASRIAAASTTSRTAGIASTIASA